MKNFIKNYWALSIPTIVLIIALLFLFKPKKNDNNQVIGMVEAHFTDVASEFPGRIDSLLVKQGDTVKKGELLAVIQSSEIHSVQQQALSSMDAAKGQLKLLQNGPRQATIESAKNLYEITQNQYNLANKSSKKIDNLYEEGIVSGQEKDMMHFKLQAAKKEMESAKLHLQTLKSGSRPEMIQSATAILKQAEHAYELSNQVARNTKIYAPASGIISTSIIHQGEIVSVGYPMMTIQRNQSQYIQFNLRQDQLKELKVGSQLSLDVPGSQPNKFNAKVSYISPALNFANWVPEKESGEFELRTFTIRCVPINAIIGLRPGMTASIKLSE